MPLPLTLRSAALAATASTACGASLAFTPAAGGIDRGTALGSLIRQPTLQGRAEESGDGTRSSAFWGAAACAVGAWQAAKKRSFRQCLRAQALAVNPDEELAFSPGQSVVVTEPPALAGSEGHIVGPVGGNDLFAVRISSGSVFNILTTSLVDASAAPKATPQAAPPRAVVPQEETEELEFQAGQRVSILAPPAMAGKQGDILGPALDDAFAVRLDSGSVFNISVDNLRDAAASSVAAAPAVGSSASPAVGGPSTYWAPASYFHAEELESKGPRGDADKGNPCCSSRVLFKGKASSVGGWTCTPGGFPVTNRSTTEVFYVLEGEGVISDADGMPHTFHSGDMVVLPKGWSGRWDVYKTIRKIWVVNNHSENLAPEESERAVVGPLDGFNRPEMKPLGKRPADWGEPEHFTKQLWQAGPTKVGAWDCTAGGFLGTPNRPTTEFFLVLQGLCFITGIDGVARRVTAGDTIVLPKGWSGRWDIIEPIHKVWVVVAE